MGFGGVGRRWVVCTSTSVHLLGKNLSCTNISPAVHCPIQTRQPFVYVCAGQGWGGCSTPGFIHLHIGNISLDICISYESMNDDLII